MDETLKNHDIELSLITLHWFLTLFASVVHMKILLRVWDLFFFGGSVVLFQTTLGMLKMKEPQLKVVENSAQIFNALSDIPGEVDDVEKLFEVSFYLYYICVILKRESFFFCLAPLFFINTFCDSDYCGKCEKIGWTPLC